MTNKKTLGLILGGGRGKRLWPLTRLRAKPAVPIAGKYRLIDIPLSNCLNSGIQNIFVLTQFNSFSLHRHITRTYHFDYFHPGSVHILPASQTITSMDWYQGTADAVRKQLYEIKVTGAEQVLILAGDHLYRMDFNQIIASHAASKADITVAVKPVSRQEVSRFGILKMDVQDHINDFIEKPQTAAEQDAFVSRDDPQLPFLGSMGIYLFNSEVLYKLLENEASEDFGHDVIPEAMQHYHVNGYTFNGYWEDIGTIRSFYEANIGLAQPDPRFSFYDSIHPVYTRPRFLPGSQISKVTLDRVLLAEGCSIEGKLVRNSVLGIRSMIGVDVVIEDTIMMGCDYYEAKSRAWEMSDIPLGIGDGSHIQGAIIDKNARIGKDVRIEAFPPGTEMETDQFHVHDGIVVIPKNAILPDGMIISPQV